MSTPELSREQIEEFREAIRLGGALQSESIYALCDMALRSLETHNAAGQKATVQCGGWDIGEVYVPAAPTSAVEEVAKFKAEFLWQWGEFAELLAKRLDEARAEYRRDAQLWNADWEAAYAKAEAAEQRLAEALKMMRMVAERAERIRTALVTEKQRAESAEQRVRELEEQKPHWAVGLESDYEGFDL